jgi:hypothetical protein
VVGRARIYVCGRHAVRRDAPRARRHLRLGRRGGPAAAPARRAGRGLPQRHRRRRRAVRAAARGGRAVRPLRRGAAVPLRARHGRPRASGAGARAARAQLRRAGRRAGLGAARERPRLRRRRQRLLPRAARRRARTGLLRDEAEQLLARNGGRTDDPHKADALDQAVWQASGPGEPAWPSPWGPGRPGWHAECTAMALSTYGPSLDLHAGGADLRFPHHAYEAAQAEAATGVAPFARSWLHVGHRPADGEKMAKSTGQPRVRRRSRRAHQRPGRPHAAARPAYATPGTTPTRRWRPPASAWTRSAPRRARRRESGPPPRRSSRRWSTTWTSPARWTSPSRTAGRRPATSSRCWRSEVCVTSAEEPPPARVHVDLVAAAAEASRCPSCP